MQPTKVYKFAAATVMTTVAAATVITFTNTEQAGSSPVAAALPRVPAAGGAAPSVGFNEQAAEPSDLPTPVLPSVDPSASPSPSPTTASQTSEPAKPKPKPKPPSPSPSPTTNGGLGGLLGNLFGR